MRPAAGLCLNLLLHSGGQRQGLADLSMPRVLVGLQSWVICGLRVEDPVVILQTTAEIADFQAGVLHSLMTGLGVQAHLTAAAGDGMSCTYWYVMCWQR